MKVIKSFINRWQYYYNRYLHPGFFVNIKHGRNFRSQTGIDAVFPELIEIGDNFIGATGSKILTHDASPLIFTNNSQLRAQKTVIGNNVFLGAYSVVMPGVQIGDNVIVGASSIVTKNIPSNSVVAGNPARYICSVDEYIAKCREKGVLYNVSNDYKEALDKGTQITIECTKTTRIEVYKQMQKKQNE